MNSARFDTLKQAVEYAKKHGGWIFATRCDTIVKWYDAAKWTTTPIMKDNAGKSGYVGGWQSHETMIVDTVNK